MRFRPNKTDNNQGSLLHNRNLVEKVLTLRVAVESGGNAIQTEEYVWELNKVSDARMAVLFT